MDSLPPPPLPPTTPHYPLQAARLAGSGPGSPAALLAPLLAASCGGTGMGDPEDVLEAWQQGGGPGAGSGGQDTPLTKCLRQTFGPHLLHPDDVLVRAARWRGEAAYLYVCVGSGRGEAANLYECGGQGRACGGTAISLASHSCLLPLTLTLTLSHAWALLDPPLIEIHLFKSRDPPLRVNQYPGQTRTLNPGFCSPPP